MVTDVFHDERQDVFWIVGVGADRRHATTMRPGAVYSGQWVPSLCDVWLKIPPATPGGREPKSRAITDRCEDCARKTAEGDFAHTIWDF
ncbi:hypothetical protein [Saccharopolyspora sp. CA-218241]|uniref:hypothetical protein n=1 Tax=Saccharopolyspora sp. CA-218241 TaxID=3240027 RepID=UPI003D951EB5